jgi:hypothetical protein
MFGTLPSKGERHYLINYFNREVREGMKAIRKAKKEKVKIEDTKEMMRHWISTDLVTGF